MGPKLLNPSKGKGFGLFLLLHVSRATGNLAQVRNMEGTEIKARAKAKKSGCHTKEGNDSIRSRPREGGWLPGGGAGQQGSEAECPGRPGAPRAQHRRAPMSQLAQEVWHSVLSSSS